MKRWVAVAAVFGLFVVGIAVGIMGTHMFYAHKMREPGSGAFGGEHFGQRLERVLDLTEDQKQEIRAIVERGRREGDAMHREMLPRVRAHMRGIADEIRGVLTSEQQSVFDELQLRHRRRAEHFFLGRGRRRPPGAPGPRRPQPQQPPAPPPEE